MNNKASQGRKELQSIIKNNYLTSVRRNRLKTLKVVEGSPDKSLQIDQPLIIVIALRNEMNYKASQDHIEEPLPDFCEAKQ
ncbi:hypothetical protein T07_3020, partial [Trichinella nelsoni]